MVGKVNAIDNSGLAKKQIMKLRSMRLKVVFHLVSVPGLATATALNAVTNDIPSIRDLVNKSRLQWKDIRFWKNIFYNFWLY